MAVWKLRYNRILIVVLCLLRGREGTVLTLAKCCRPIPGDNIQGFITPGQGVVVHRVSCKKYQALLTQTKRLGNGRMVGRKCRKLLADIVVVLINKPGALARVATLLSSMRANIEHIRFDNQGDTNTTIRFSLSVESRHHLARIIRRLRNFSVVQSVKREN